MCTRTLFSFLSFVFLSGHLSAENWHPFPFKIAYYGVKAELGKVEGSGWPAPPPYISSNGPIAKGHIVDGLYLDQTFSQGTNQGRKRSATYPASQLFGSSDGSNFRPFINESSVVTSTDSQTVVTVIESVYPLSGTYYPKRINQGSIAFGNSGIVSGITVQTVFGEQDSVATVVSNSDTLTWSKKFGILHSFKSWGNKRLSLMGVKDLGLGYKDQVSTLRNPSPGDEFHFLKVSKGSINCWNPFGGTYTEFADSYNTVRAKIIQAESEGAQVQIIEAEIGSSTGIEYNTFIPYYEESANYSMSSLADSSYPVGSNPTVDNIQSWVTYLGWIDSLGNPFKIINTEIIDGTPTIQFVPCSKMPLGYMKTKAYYMTQFCSGSILNFHYPVYGKVQGACVFGTPFDSVQITSTSAIYNGSNGFKISPNPAGLEFRINGVFSGEFAIMDGLGRVVRKGIISENPIEVRDLSSGIYVVQIKQDGKILSREKLVKK